MLKIADAFSCEPPFGWDESRRQGSWVYRRPERELVISFWPVKDPQKVDKRHTQLEALMKTALKALKKEHKNPNLEQSVPLTRIDENQLEFWVQSLSTRDGTVSVSSAAVRGHTGVLVVTLEAPHKPETFPLFVQFLRSVRSLTAEPSHS